MNTARALEYPAPRRALAPVAGVIAAAAAATAGLAALAAGFGAQPYALGGLAAAGLVVAGARLPADHSRTFLLLALLLVPEAVSSYSFGLRLRWSAGLTLSNLLLPALAVPLLAGAWLGGQRLFPRPWPRFAAWYLALLGWSAATLLYPGGAAAGRLTVAGHAVKLLLFLLLGLFFAGAGEAARRRAAPALAIGLAANAAAGLAQAAGWLPVFSPLGARQPLLGVRASGLFYDANMYAALVAWGLLWLVCRLARPGGRRDYAGWILAAALAANLAAAGSRAGYLAFAAGLLALLARRRARAALLGAALMLALLGLAPARGWQRIRAAGRDAGSAERLASMREAARQIARHPLLGLGFGRALYLGAPAIGDPARSFNGAQNMPLTVWAETGPAGLALLCAALWQPFRRLRRRADAPLLAGYVGLLAASLTIEILWNARLLALLVLLTS